MKLKEIEGYAFSPRLLENILDVERMRVPRKYFSGEISSHHRVQGAAVASVQSKVRPIFVLLFVNYQSFTYEIILHRSYLH